MSNINLPVNPGESKTLTFNTADTYMPENLVFNIEGDSILKTISGTTAGSSTSGSYLSTKWRINDTDTELRDGRIIMLRVPSVRGVSTAGTVLSIDNGTTYRPVAYNVSILSTHYDTNSTIILVYNENIKLDYYLTSNTKTSNVYGVWCAIGDYDSNSNTIGYQLRTNSYTLQVSEGTGRYRLLFTSADGTKFVPACTGTSTSGTSAKTVCQTPIDPFKNVLYYGSTTILSANGTPSVSVLWQQYNITLGYSFCPTADATITDKKPVYVKCAPQTNGSAVIDSTTPYVQDLPTTEDGKIYKFIGVATSTTTLELNAIQPVYRYKNGKIQLYTGLEDSDTNTTYTFESGTNGFTVTPSGGTAIPVDVTPSITNNALTTTSVSGTVTGSTSTSAGTVGGTVGSPAVTITKKNVKDALGYTPADVDHTHGYIDKSGKMTDSVTSVGKGEYILIRNITSGDENDKVRTSSVAFGDDSSMFLNQTGGWSNPLTGVTIPSSGTDLPHHHTYDKASLNGNASSGVSYISALTIPDSNNVATAGHTHTYYKQVLNGDASSGTAYVSSITAASSGHTHSYKKATLNGNATSGTAYLSNVTAPGSNTAATATHTHTYYKQVLNGDASSGTLYVSSITAASSDHTHSVPAQAITLTANDETATGRISYVSSVSKTSGGAASAGHTHTFTQPTISLGSNTTSTNGVAYVESVTKTTNGAASGTHTHPYKLQQLDNTATTGGVTYVESITASATNHTHTFTQPTISLGSNTTSTDGVTYVESVGKVTNGAASAGHTHTFTQPTITLTANTSTATGRITYVESVTKVTDGAASGTHTHPYKKATMTYNTTASGGEAYLSSVTAPSANSAATATHTHTYAKPTYTFNSLGDDCYELEFGTESTATGSTGQASAGMKALIASNFTTKYMHFGEESTASGTTSQTTSKVDTIGTVTTKYMSASASNGAVQGASGTVDSIGTVTTKYFHPTVSGGSVGAASGTTSGTTKHLTLSLESTASGTTSQTTSKVDTIGTVTTKYFHPTATSGAVGAASGTVDVIGTVTTKYLSAANTANTTGTPSGTTSGTSKNLAIEDASSTTNTGTPSAGIKALVSTDFTSKNLAIGEETTASGTTGTPSGTTSGTSKNLAIEDASSTTNTGAASAGTKAVTGGTSKNLGVSYTTTNTSSVINN